MNVTKVICQNCGAEVIIPEHECNVTGVAIGKDSGLGTVILPTKDGSSATNTLDALKALANGNSEVLKMVTHIVEKIENSGYLDVDGIVRRWIPSQCLAMFYSPLGFFESLRRHGYDYSWKVLTDELKRQAKLLNAKDSAGFADRSRWYNKSVASVMARDYYDQLKYYIDSLPIHSHRGRNYKKISCWVNNGKGIHTDEMRNFLVQVEAAALRIGTSNTHKELCDSVTAFDTMRKRIKFSPKRYCNAFFNVYKAAGAYYTMKDLIMFENCRMQVLPNGSTDRPDWRRQTRSFVEMEESLAALERKATEIVAKGVIYDGYMMLGLLEDFLEYNNFNFETTKAKWAEQSEMRKVFRSANRKNRRSRK